MVQDRFGNYRRERDLRRSASPSGVLGERPRFVVQRQASATAHSGSRLDTQLRGARQRQPAEGAGRRGTPAKARPGSVLPGRTNPDSER